ncbi:MAG TPA: GNA1162 family protein [Geobacteraceae bacterium]
MKITRSIRQLAGIVALAGVLFTLQACASSRVGGSYRDSNMDFGSVKTVAVLPFVNLSKDLQASDRVRDVFTTSLLATGAVYVIPTGEVARGIAATGLANIGNPSVDEAIKFCRMVKADAVITGTIREYGEIRSGTASSDVVSLSLQMMEGQTGKVVWSASTTQGGITFLDRLLGGGGRPLNVTTEKAVHDLINKLFE